MHHMDQREQRDDSTSIILELSHLVCASLDRDEVFARMLDAVRRLSGAEIASLMLLDPQQQVLRMVAADGLAPELFDHCQLRLGEGIAGWVALYGQPVHVAQAGADPRFLPLVTPNDATLLCLPLRVRGQTLGVLSLVRQHSKGLFRAAVVQAVEIAANQVALALDSGTAASNNQRMYVDAQMRTSQFQLLHQFSARLNSFHEVGPLLDEAAYLLHHTFGYYQVLIGLVEGENLVAKTGYGVLTRADAWFFQQRFSLYVGLAGYVARTGETMLVNDVRTDTLYVALPELPATAAELLVAIKIEEQIFGIIIIESTQTDAFSRYDAQLVEALAGQTALRLAYLACQTELRRSTELLTQSERLRTLGELASGMAHDFNNLLTGILGHTQLLLNEELPNQLLTDLRVIERAAIDGAATVRRLQNFAQTSRALPSEEVDLNEVLSESLAITRPRWRDYPQSRGITITIRHEMANLPMIAGDGPALRDLATNLILNAIDALATGGELTLRTALIEPKRSPLSEISVLLEVRDNGIGMSSEVRSRIFTPFFTTKGLDGTGMGMTMVFGIVQSHRGQIDVISAPQQGTSVRIYLPVRSAQPREASRMSQPSQTVAHTILVVDDDDAVRQVLVRQLERLGHRIVGVQNGAEALHRLADQRFSILCTDLGMPGMSGWDLITHARILVEDLKVILVTGWGEQLSIEEARDRGADVVLAKPFEARRLQQVVAELVGEQ
ncbi:MAG: GAF domain-containing protein [Candidatus Viridilinea halotolerans]|uniref:histidine kinase n=1 Tax=Candidatus Viridilinea halotolerans TaxID=2491704 RepID=A0A426UC51_9CHLR|nr:MAG: GAF domain-containing protein [Candidatus Viridilinea halotolerans]